jgi:hypothetical protein
MNYQTAGNASLRGLECNENFLLFLRRSIDLMTGSRKENKRSENPCRLFTSRMRIIGTETNSVGY